MGRQVHSRTVSLSATFTSRSRGEPPDWLLWVRRPGTSQPGISTLPSEVDVERAVAESTVTYADVTVGVDAVAPLSDDEPKTPPLDQIPVIQNDQSKAMVSFEIDRVRIPDHLLLYTL